MNQALAGLVVLLFAAAADAQVAAAPGGGGETKVLEGFDSGGGVGARVLVVPIEGTIELGLSAFVERAVRDATTSDRVILVVNTFGGRIDAAVKIRDALLKTKATTIAFVEQRAISAGALISLACDTIIMAPGASIGAATPVQMGADGGAQPTSEKVVSYMRAEMRSTAEAKGRRGDLAEAMVDPDIEIPGVSPKGKLLTLTTDKAVELSLADARVETLDQVIELLNLGKAQRQVWEADWGEQLARGLTDPVVSSLLMTFGVLGILIELYTPGLGLGGIVGATCLVLFFGGQYAASLAGWEEVLLFVVGIALIAVEVFVLPGFGVAGILGLLTTAVALILAMINVDLPFDVAFELGYVQEMVTSALLRMAIAFVAIIVGFFLIGRLLPRTRGAGGIVLNSDTDAKLGYVTSPPEDQLWVGKSGETHTTLRPAGIATIEGKRVDVVSMGEFIPAGTSIEVVQVDGNRIVVRALKKETP